MKSAKASTSFFEKKEAKKLLIPLVRKREATADQIKKKFFASFFQKRSAFLDLLSLTRLPCFVARQR